MLLTVNNKITTNKDNKMSFIIHNKDSKTNKEMTIKVWMRGAYTSTITSEKKLITALTNGAQGYIERGSTGYGESILKQISEGHIIEVCNTFGVLTKTQTISIKQQGGL